MRSLFWWQLFGAAGALTGSLRRAAIPPVRAREGTGGTKKPARCSGGSTLRKTLSLSNSIADNVAAAGAWPDVNA